MRITSGKYKYRQITVPAGIRPTTGKVREAVFSMIAPWIPGAVVLDLFAGSGGMGLEALSRGAEYCWFCELSRQNQKVLSDNIRNCGAQDSSSVCPKDFRAALAGIADSGREVRFDIVILDPPYSETGYYGQAMDMLQEYGLLDEGSIVVAEHLYENRLEESYGGLHMIKSKKYGSIGVDVFLL